MYLLLLNYVRPLAEVEQYITAHVAFLDKFYAQNKFIVSGRRKPRTGGVILARADSLAEVQQIINQDPFHQNGAAEYDIIEFAPTNFDPQFASFVD